MRASAGFRWTVRLLIWGAAAAVALPMYTMGRAFGTVGVMEQCANAATQPARGGNSLYSAQQFALCMFLQSGYLESRRQEPLLREVMALREAPCERTGIWKSARHASVYRVTLTDDNRFHAEALSDFSRGPYSGDSTGWWGETRGKLVWIYDDGHLWPPDVNRLEAESPDRFTLVEVDGQRTEFTRERRLGTSRCPA